MTNMTLAIPEDLRKIMRKHNEVKWSSVAREALWNYAKRIEKLAYLDELLKDSKLTEEDTIELGRKINRGIAKRHGLIK